MRKLSMGILAFSMLLGFSACNNTGNSNDSATEKADSTMHHDMHHADNMSMPPAVPDDAAVFFKNLKDGQTVSSPVKVEMGVKDMTVEPSGEVKEGFGHHHLLIDAGNSVALGKIVPADEHHIHYGAGQTETELTLTPGQHQLTLQFADGLHRSYGSQLATSITITVK